MNNAKVRYIAGAVILVLVVAGWYFFYYSSLSTKVSASAQVITTDQQNLALLQSKLEGLVREDKNLPTLKREASALQRALPSSPQLPQLFNDFNQAAASSGLPLINITPTPPSSTPQAAGTTSGSPSKATAPSIFFSIQTEGGYYQVESFLKDLDTLSRLVNVESVSISAAGQHVPGYPSSEGEILSVTIKGQAFESQGTLQ
ncbi:Tfp pilus assembly protein PilO [Ferrithrix thermotolerans DSM 19514]|uniref:Tfp pilus assembly protein PilO n=1 Tax=Ferrithrix thermotolerans DSM 19514 TaxID=1121881 RepID=A0A1M4T4P0_9ACTN|nr:type 4a pilus biogenesis protein PilO [Ferrithrix thermotolerans]SHE39390.1 Tfp pilus assembly protein PilO [Ferrithrix thermotolerans DSM 19514]